ncbi:hypothetical protein [Prosthecobacter sp.]|uniref:hypothetical protein n=1 Tax=Prosthecobacter sp. TaxID=1965333 RepID=UPI003783D46F
MKLNSPVVNAAQRIRAEAYKQCLKLSDLEKIVKADPVAKWPEYNLTFHVRQVIDWSDGDKPTTSFIATLRGQSTSFDLARSILVLERAEKQDWNKIPTLKARYEFSLIIEIENDINGLKAWLNCETGELEVGEKWPKSVPATTTANEERKAA